MNRIKKTLVKGLALAMAATLSFGIVGCSFFEKSEAEKEKEFISSIGGVSETYMGSVSMQSYNSAAKAAEAYVQEQVVGEKEATVVNTKSNGELTPSQVEQLSLPASVQEGIISVEEIEVEYSASKVSYSSTNNQNKKVKVYVIKYANDWKYYTPAPITGETISKSYYDSVFNYEKYKNCTVVSTTEINLDAMLVLNVNMTMTQVVKHAEDKILIEQTTSFSILGEEQSLYISAYIEETGDNSHVCYVQQEQNGIWEEAALSQIGFNSLEELTPFYNQYLDYTYFTKTDYGFRMSDENAQQYVKQSLEKEEALKEYIALGENLNMDLFIKFYVSNGVLSGMRQDASFKLDVNYQEQQVKVDVSMVAQTTCSDYGATVVSKPNLG